VSVDINNMTLEELRGALAGDLPADVAFDGWTTTALQATAERLGVDSDVARLAFPDGALQMIDAWFASVDADMLAACPPETLATLMIRP